MMTVRLAKPEEAEQIVNWIEAQDPYSLDAFGKNTMTLAAENGTLRMAMPVQATLFIESMPRNPGNRHRETVVALVKLLESVERIAKHAEVKHIYFMATTKEIERQGPLFGFERVEFPVFRKRVR